MTCRLRGLIPAELAKGFGFFQSKPSSAFSPVAVTPDELGDAWDGGKVHLPLHVDLNGKPFGRANAGIDMTFDFPTLIAHAAKTRPLGAGTIIGSGTVSNKLDGGPGKPVEEGGRGYSCIAETPHDRDHPGRRAADAIPAFRRSSAHRDEGSLWPFDLRRDRAASNQLRTRSMNGIVLYDYWRSSASYRVRIALNRLRLEYETVPVNLLKDEHKGADNLSRNPQGLVPTLAMDGRMMTQSLAIIEYLDEIYLDAGFLPQEPAGRQRVRALSYAIAMETHPVCNMGVMAHILFLTEGGDKVRIAWMRKFIAEGLSAFEAMLQHPDTGKFCHGNTPGMADFCLVPQVYNAKRWGVKTSGFKRISAIVKRCRAIDAFAAAHPDKVKQET